MRTVPRLMVIVVVLAMSVMVALPVSAAPRDTSNLLQPPPPCPTPVANTHCVQPGEWLYCVGRAYQVTPWAIAQASGIPGPYATYNPYRGYGDLYYGYYGGYHPPYYYPYYAPWNYVYPGQRLTIPFNASTAWYNIPAGPICAKQA